MVGEYMILKRKELGIKRKDLAEKLKISYNYLNLIETNKRPLSEKLIPKVAKIFGVEQKEIEFYNITETHNKFYVERKLVEKQMNIINKKLAKLDTEKVVLEKEREFLCEKMALLKSAEISFMEERNYGE